MSAFAVQTVQAQAFRPTHTAREEMRIPADPELNGIWSVLVGRGGMLAIPQIREGEIKFFSSTGSLLGKAGRRGEGPGEYRIIGETGWVGDTMWVNDGLTRRLSWIGPDFKLLRSTPYPTRLMNGSAGTFDSATGIRSFMVIGVTPQRSLIVSASIGAKRSRDPLLSTLDTGMVSALRVGATGVIERLLAPVPRDECSIPYATPKLRGGVTVPFCAEPILTAAPDGRSILVVSRIGTLVRPTGFRVLLVGDDGVTRLRKDVTVKPLPIPAQIREDEVPRLVATSVPGMGEAYRGIAVPHSYPPFRDALLGIDGTIWVEVADGAAGHHWVAFAPTGERLVEVTLAKSVRLRAASRTSLWASETDSDGLVHVVRLALLRAGTAQG